MIDERIRIQENYDMTLETAIDEAREEGRKQLVCEIVSRGMTPELLSDMTGLSLKEIKSMLA